MEICQFVGKFKTVIPPKMDGYKKLRRAIQSQLKLGANNMLRGIMSQKWGEIQDRYSETIGRTKGATQNENASKAFLTFSINMRKHRCEVLHKIKEGTQDESNRADSLTTSLDLQSELQRVLPSFQHLCKRSLKKSTHDKCVAVETIM